MHRSNMNWGRRSGSQDLIKVRNSTVPTIQHFEQVQDHLAVDLNYQQLASGNKTAQTIQLNKDEIKS